MLKRIRSLAGKGRLAQACVQLDMLLKDPKQPTLEHAHCLLLHGRCQLGMLACAKAVIALTAAADNFLDCGENELAEYAQALRLRHALDERRSQEVRVTANQLLQTADSQGWPLVGSISHLYSGLGANEQRRFSDAVKHFKAYLDTADPYRLPWEETMARFALEGSVKRGGLDRGILGKYGRGPADDNQLRVPRIHVMTQIYQALALLGDNQLELCLDVLTDLRGFLENCPGEWAGRLRFIANVESNLGYVHQHLYNHAESLEHYINAIKLARERGFTAITQLAQNNMAVVLLWSRKFDQALENLTRSRAGHSQSTYVFQVSTYYLAIAHLAQGQTGDAQDIWSGRTVFDDNPETRKTLDGIGALLEHLFPENNRDSQPGSTAPWKIAREWIREIAPED